MIDLRKTIKKIGIMINDMSFSGKSINIKNNRIIIDGVDVSNNFKNDKKINITINSNIDSISVDSCNKFKMNGNAHNIKTVSGDITFDGDSVISGDVTTTSGDIKCGYINGNAKTVSGDIKSDNINGNCSTVSGDISK